MPGEPEPGLAQPTNVGPGENNHSVQPSGLELLTDRMRRSSPASRSYVLGYASGRSTLTPTRHQRAPATRTPNPTTPTPRPTAATDSLRETLDKSGSFKDADLRALGGSSAWNIDRTFCISRVWELTPRITSEDELTPGIRNPALR
jgi:hypothetical protein